ncbi:MAG: permease [Deltaproteobacteria bacterium]|nr:permease [Deltaproteobacteria bacterium]
MTTRTASCCSPPTPRPIRLAVVQPRLALRPFLLATAAWVAAYLAAEPLGDLLAYRLLGLAKESALGAAVAFFAYEAPKVLLLLVAVVFLIGIANTWFTAERTRRILAGRREAVGNVLAALLGVVTPFCSCSAVPLFIGFVEAGIPLGVTFSFLISAPMVNEVALVLLFGLFGWRIASIYLITGLTIAVLSGWVLGRLGMEQHVEEWVRDARARPVLPGEVRLGLGERAWKGVESVRKVVGKTWPYVLAGIGVGAFIHGWVPEGILAGIMGKQAWWSVPLAVAIGVPMYAGTATLIPIVQALLAKGAALGTVLAFMMAVVGLSLPEFILLRRVLRPRLLGAFIGVVSVGILFVGWLFNAAL